LIGCNLREQELENGFFLSRSAAMLKKKPVPKTSFLQISPQKIILKQLHGENYRFVHPIKKKFF